MVYDPVGGNSFEEALKVVKWGAQILIIGFASGDIPKVRLHGKHPCAGGAVCTYADHSTYVQQTLQEWALFPHLKTHTDHQKHGRHSACNFESFPPAPLT